MVIQNIIDKEENVISSHRWHIDDMVELVKKVLLKIKGNVNLK